MILSHISGHVYFAKMAMQNRAPQHGSWVHQTAVELMTSVAMICSLLWRFFAGRDEVISHCLALREIDFERIEFDESRSRGQRSSTGK